MIFNQSLWPRQVKVSARPPPLLQLARLSPRHSVLLKKDLQAVNYGLGRVGVAYIAEEYLDLNDQSVSTKGVALSLMKKEVGMV